MQLEFYAALKPEAVRWLAHGHRGVSSNTLFALIYGIQTGVDEGSRMAPADSGDFRRCRLMADDIPGARQRILGITDIRAIGYQRDRILTVVKHWDALCALMDSESPDWRSPKASSPSPKLNAVLRHLASGAMDRVAGLPESQQATISGSDEVDIRRGLFLERELSLNGVDAQRVKRTLEHFQAIPVESPDLDGKTCLHLLRGCLAGVMKIGQIGSDAATQDRAKKLIAGYAGLDKYPVPRNEKATKSIRYHLNSVLTFLWRESHFDLDTAEAKEARLQFESMTRLLDVASKAHLAASSPNTTGEVQHKVGQKRRVATA
ncbi:hypothetical protein [Paucibacter soli]|uniref:hypothetical protein n=1 Tax=Paucibacter soli TaxID=3133433 RepID=UPI0030B7538A